MKTKRRHELHTNMLADWLGHRIDQIRPYFAWILVGVAALVAIGLLLTFIQGNSQSQLDASWNSLEAGTNDAFIAIQQNDDLGFQQATKQIEQVKRDYAGAPLGQFADVWLGDLYLERGEALINVNRTAAMKNFDSAVVAYSAASDSITDPLVKSRVLYNLGKSQEWMFQLDKARATYKKVQGLFKDAAQKRLDDLATNDAVQVYDKLQKIQPQPQFKPGTRPGEDFGNSNDDLWKKLGTPPPYKPLIDTPPADDKSNSKGAAAPGTDKLDKDKKDGAGDKKPDKSKTEVNKADTDSGKSKEKPNSDEAAKPAVDDKNTKASEAKDAKSDKSASEKGAAKDTGKSADESSK